MSDIVLAFSGFGAGALVGAQLGQTLLKTILLLAVRPHPVWPLFEPSAGRKCCVFLNANRVQRSKLASLSHFC